MGWVCRGGMLGLGTAVALAACGTLEASNADPPPNPDLDAASDAPPVPPDDEDAGPTIVPGEVDSGLCTITGTILTPIGFVCNKDAAQQLGGGVAGLDTNGNAGTTIDGSDVYSCVVAEFATAITRATIALAAVPDACGPTKCGVLGDGADGCGTGNYAQIFGGPDVLSLKKLGSAQDLTTITTTVTTNLLDPGTRVVAVCRSLTSPKRDDIAVDAILGRVACGDD